MTLDRSLAIITALLLGIVLVTSSTILVSSARQRLSESKASDMRTTGLLLTTAMSQAASLSLTHAALIADNPQVVALMRSGDRAGLQQLLAASYQTLASEAGVNMLHFHSADLKSFLRVQDPGNFGQDLSKIRPMVLAANRSHLAQKGLEVGLAGLSLRGVSAILDGETVVGTVEVGVDLKTLMELAKSASGADYALYLSPAMSGVPTTGAPGDTSSTVLAMATSTNSALFEALNDKGQIKLAREPVQGSAEIGTEDFGLFGQPLLDYSGRMIGTVIIAQNFSGLDSSLQRSVLTACAVTLTGLIAAFAIVMITLRTLVIRPLADLGAYGRAVAGGLVAVAPQQPASGLSEFKILRAAVDRLASPGPGPGTGTGTAKPEGTA
ncbi:MAG: cache domain-containing protein [Allorhizobium sp.]